jgi:predicted CopG family antitoxin
MKTLLVSDELYEKLKEASDIFKKYPSVSLTSARYSKELHEFLETFKEADNPCLDCPKKEYRETINNRR